MEIYLCRHGETKWTLSGQHTGNTDIPLTETGKEQVSLLKRRLTSIHFDSSFSSPMQRAQLTSQAVGLKAMIDPDLAEWNYGDYEGLTREEILKKNPSWDLFTQGAPNGESPEEVSLRADRFLQKVSQKKGSFVVFSHGHFIRVLAVRWLGLKVDAARFFVLNVASLGCLGMERSQRAITLWNNTDYLHDF